MFKKSCVDGSGDLDRGDPMSQFRPAVTLISVFAVCVSFFVMAADDTASEAASSGASSGEVVIPAAASVAGA